MSNRNDLELPVRIDRMSRVPVHRQLAEVLRRAIREGALAPGARLPSTRALAETLGIARNVALVAFDELYADRFATGSGHRDRMGRPIDRTKDRCLA